MAQFAIYTSRGDWAGMLVGNYLYNTNGEWVGYLTRAGNVFSVLGKYVGWLSKDFRILRKKVQGETVPAGPPPPRPALKVRVPATAPLASLMAELPFGTFDVLAEEPERLHTLDDDRDAPDMD